MEENVRVCSHCGRELDADEGLYVGGDLLCDRCVDDFTVTCDHCGERIWSDDAWRMMIPFCVMTVLTAITTDANAAEESSVITTHTPGNGCCDRTVAGMSDAVIIAWGSVGRTCQRVRERQEELLEKLNRFENKLYQIGTEGYHPLTPAIRTGWSLEPFQRR